MQITLSADMERLIRDRLNSGRYNSATEVIGEALRLMTDRDSLQSITRETVAAQIKAGMASLRRGDGHDGDAVFDRLDAELDALDKRAAS